VGYTFEENKNLVYFVLKKYFSVDNEFHPLFDDYSQIGFIGLLKAIKGYDASSKGNTFATYACTAIKNEILMYLRNDKNSKLNYSYLEDEVSKDKDDNTLKLLDVLGDHGFEDNFIKQDGVTSVLKYILNNYKELLKNEKESQLFEILVNSNFRLTQAEIAEIFGVSQSVISRRRKTIQDKLKKAIKRRLSFQLDN
jgi:RNA polymerase sigma factor (sigma-70 family)